MKEINNLHATEWRHDIRDIYLQQKKVEFLLQELRHVCVSYLYFPNGVAPRKKLAISKKPKKE